MARCAGVTGRVVQVDDDDDEKLVSLEKKQIQLVGTKITLSSKRERWKIQLTQTVCMSSTVALVITVRHRSPVVMLLGVNRCFDRV